MGLETGTILARSGDWEWYLIELQSLPDWETAVRKLHFKDPQDSKNEMVKDLPLDLEFSKERVGDLIHHPEERRVRDHQGDVWTVRPVDRPPIAMAVSSDFEHPPHEIVFWAPQRQAGRSDLPQGLFLGDLTNEELVRLMGLT